MTLRPPVWTSLPLAFLAANFLELASGFVPRTNNTKFSLLLDGGLSAADSLSAGSDRVVVRAFKGSSCFGQQP